MSLTNRLLDRPEEEVPAAPPPLLTEWLRPGARVDVRFMVVGYMEMPTMFGKAVLYRLRDEGGNVLEWLAHGRLAHKKRLLRPGRVYFARATVKGTRAEAGHRITTLSRLTLTEGQQLPAAL